MSNEHYNTWCDERREKGVGLKENLVRCGDCNREYIIQIEFLEKLRNLCPHCNPETTPHSRIRLVGEVYADPPLLADLDDFKDPF